jgi:N-acetylmuramoyl-L-alanine amidase
VGGSPANVRSMRAIGALCRDAGLRVVEAAGWTDRGRTWATLKPEHVVCHHTAATIDIDRVLIDGRADLPGPICNWALHADDTVVLIASGLANHAGTATISSTQSYGIEATGPIPAGASGPAAFPNYDAYVVLVAAIRLHHGWGNDRVTSHKEIALPKGRKIDPAFDMHNFRAAVDRKVKTWGTEGDLTMADAQAILDELKRMRQDLTVFGTTGLEPTVEDFATRQRDTLAALKRLEAKVDAIENQLAGP